MSTTKSSGPLQAPATPPQPPLSGSAWLRERWGQYSKLMRLHSKTWPAHWIPFVMGSIHAAMTAQTFDSWEFAKYQVMLLVYCLVLGPPIMVWNDLCDVDVDAQVPRTAGRPLPSGAVSIREAQLLLAAVMALVLGITSAFPNSFWWATVVMVPSQALYPYLKRTTAFVQVYLAAAYAWFVVMGVFVLPNTAYRSHMTLEQATSPMEWQKEGRDASTALICLFLTYVAQMTGLEVIYNYQDVEDDRRLGLKSMSSWIYGRSPVLQKGFFGSIFAVQTLLLLAWGRLMLATPVFYATAIPGVVLATAMVLRTVELSNPATCGQCFVMGIRYNGGAMMLGMLAELVASRSFLGAS